MRSKLILGMVLVLGLVFMGSAVASAQAGKVAVSTGANNPAAATVNNMEVDLAILQIAFAETSGAAASIDTIALTPYGNIDDAADISTLEFYQDINGDGIVNGSDSLIAVTPTTGFAANDTKQKFALANSLTIGSLATVNLLVRIDLAGTATEAETLIVKLDDASTDVIGSGTFGGSAIGNKFTIDENLKILSRETVDYNEDGILDAIHITMNDQVDDYTIISGDWTINGGNNFLVFESTFHGLDEANDADFYLEINTSVVSAPTDSTPTVGYTAGTMTNLAGNNKALSIAADTSVDKAPPVITKIEAKDNDSNGYLDVLEMTMSEDITNVDTLGFTISEGGYTYNFAGTPATYLSPILTITLGERNTTDTGVRPQVVYDDAIGDIRDLAPAANGLRDITPGEEPVTDKAPPILMSATTGDAIRTGYTQGDGRIDTYTLVFSELVTGNNDGGEDDFSTNTSGYTLGNFTSTPADGDSTDTILLTISGPGDLDTEVKPEVLYNGAGNEFTDLATSPNALDSIAAGDLIESDGARPVIGSAVTADTDGNGKLDRMVLTFSEPIADTIPDYGAGFDLRDAHGNYGFTGQHNAPGGKVIFLNLSSVGGGPIPFDTETKPQVNYTPGYIDDPSHNTLLPVDDDDLVETDGAAPVLYQAVTADTDSNRSIDQYVFTFSEDLSNVSDFTGTGFSLSSPYGLANGVESSPGVMTLDITGGIANDTEVRPDVTYNKTVGNITDNNGAPLDDILSGDLIETDGAAPILISAETMDADGNGKIDHYKLTFTEDMADASFNGANWNVAGYANEAFDFTVSGDSPNDDVVYLGFDEGTFYDTDATPDCSTGVAVATDTTGNTLLDVASGDYSASTNKLGVTEQDKALPVIVKAIAVVNDKNLNVTFSEPVWTNTGQSGALVASDFGYEDVNVGHATAVDAVVGASGGDEIYNLLADSNFTIADVVNDSIYAQADQIYDHVNNAAPTTRATINDDIPPELIRAEVLDRDADGMIDHYRLTFSEGVDDDTFDPIKWHVAGYTNVAIDSVAGHPPNDEVIYIRFDESGTGDTDAKPEVTADQGAISDFKPNPLVAVVEATVVEEDKAGPAIMSAITTSTITLDVTFSEPLNMSTVQYWDFDLYMNAGWQWITAINGGPEVVSLTADPGWIAGQTGTIALEDDDDVADVVSPANWNDQTSAVAVTSGVIIVSSFAVTASSDTVTTGVPFNIGVAALDASGDTLTTYTGPVFISANESGVTYPEGPQVLTAGVGTFSIIAGNTSTSLVVSVYNSDYSASGSTSQLVAIAPTIDAPNTLITADVPGDQGYYDKLTWDFSANHPGVGTYNLIEYYQLYRVVYDTLGGQTWYTGVTVTATDPTVAGVDSVRVVVFNPTPLDSTGYYVQAVDDDSYSGVKGVFAVRGEWVKFDPGKGQQNVSALTGPALAQTLDNLPPTKADFVRAMDAPGDVGGSITVTWNPSSDDKIVVSNEDGVIWGVSEYWIYRDEVKVGAVSKGVAEYTDETVENYPTTYDYTVYAYDGTNLSEVSNTEGAYAADNSQIADFTSEGYVDVNDLSLLADQWHIDDTALNWDDLYDLVVDGYIDVNDLSVLADHWHEGTPAQLTPGPNAEAKVSIEYTAGSSPNQLVVEISAAKVNNLSGYEFTLSYEADQLTFLDASGGELLNSLGGETPVLLSISNPGELKLANVIARATEETAPEGDGLIARINFRMEGKGADLKLDDIGFIDVNGTKDVIPSPTGVNPLHIGDLIPRVYSLNQNYPNPFNPTTQIMYGLPRDSQVELKVFNIMGQEVTTLVNGWQKAGYRSVVWDGRDNSGHSVASGVYFYRLKAGEFNSIKKMVLLK